MTESVIVLTWLDAAILIGAALLVLVVGFRSARQRHSTYEFLVAGRSLTLPVFVATLVSTWYGGILGVGEFAWRYGVATWVVFGLPYYLFAIVFAFLLAPRIRRSEVLSIPDRLEQVYGRPAALVGAVLTFLLVNPAPYVLMLGLLSNMFFGGPLIVHLLGGLVLSGVFLLAGGFRAGVMTNVAEFVMMYVGFAAMVVLAVPAAGGVEGLLTSLPASHVDPTGGQSPQFIVVWFLIALWTMVDPSFHQRAAAAKDERTARNGILVSVLFWFLFDAMTVTTGLVARVLIPDLTDPAMAYPQLAVLVLPAGIRGLFFVALGATVMSTLTSMLMLGGLTAGRDFAARRSGIHDPQRQREWVRVGTVVAGLVGVLLAWALPSVVTLWYAVGTALIPGLLLPVLGSYVPALRINGTWAVRLMVFSSLVSTLSLGWGHWMAVDGAPNYWWGMEPIVPGLIVSGVMWMIGRVGSGKEGK
ncbi:MAG: sodium:solute symporter family protein [Bacteroidetes bacterium]|jgi:SSS family solute:Na+ symporter|nr:sodium:solute symporter family protein [Bacteroidota bacterium]